MIRKTILYYPGNYTKLIFEKQRTVNRRTLNHLSNPISLEANYRFFEEPKSISDNDSH